MIKLLKNSIAETQSSPLIKYLSLSNGKHSRNFHKTIQNYKPTPLVELNKSAIELGVNKLWLKDESHRMGLKAFKVLGASYAIANYLYKKLGWSEQKFSFQKLLDTDLSNFTFVTATDGNHGRGVAWVAHQLGCKSYIFMPSTSSEARIQNIEEFASEVSVIDGNYDAASKYAKKFAEEKSAVLIQDSSWDGYTDLPLVIMQGYLTLIDEVYEQLNGENFTHILLQCGVGSLPAAIEAYLVNRFGIDKPKTIIVEPSKADCFYQSMGKGERFTVQGKLDSIMAGLSCGTPSKLAWDILSKHSNYFLSCDDEIAKLGMRELAKLNVVSGESGAVSYGILKYAFEKDKALLEKLGINKDSKIMLISTEGDTDPSMYDLITGRNKTSSNKSQSIN